jgi:DNA-directed RNA polymerase specialized sigma24 family protein
MLRVDPLTEIDGIERTFRDHQARLWKSLVLATGSADVASEAVSEAFAQAIARGEAIRDPAAWVWTAAFKIAKGELARLGSEGPFTGEFAIADPEPLVDVLRALAELTVHQRTAVVLADYVGYRHAEIAKILGSTTAAVAVHVHRGRRRLRSLLEVNDG